MSARYPRPLVLGGQQFGLYRTASETIWQHADAKKVRRAYENLTGHTGARVTDMRVVVRFALQIQWYMAMAPFEPTEHLHINYRRARRAARASGDE